MVTISEAGRASGTGVAGAGIAYPVANSIIRGVFQICHARISDGSGCSMFRMVSNGSKVSARERRQRMR